MDHGDMGDTGVIGQALVRRPRVHRLVLAPFEDVYGTAHDAGDVDHALPIGAVDQDQQLAVPRDQRPYGGFDDEGARALERDADVGLFGTGQRHQAGT